MSGLHSRYQPQQEADRFIHALHLSNDADCYILIEPGQGYLISALRKAFPDKKIIALHADICFREFESLNEVIPRWYPGSETGVQEFLEKEIAETDKVKIIEWRPSLNAYGERYLLLLRQCTDFIKQNEAVKRTTAAFGLRWVKNFFRNLMILEKTLLYKTMDVPVVITGAGPGLELDLPLLSAARENIFLLSASSSVQALAAGGIVPDMVIGTDGGGWALAHLYACSRRHGACALSLSLSAAMPSQCAALPVLPVIDGSYWQGIAINAAGIPSLAIPQRGTVTASALELALHLSTNKIFLSGMDLSIRGIVSHARPYGLDYQISGSASRLRPAYGQYFVRSGEIKAGGSYAVYAAWFKRRLGSLQRQVFYLNESGLPALHKKLDANCFKQIDLPGGNAAGRCKKAAEALIAALRSPQQSEALSAELSPLLFPSPGNASAAEIADSVYRISRRYWGGNCG